MVAELGRYGGERGHGGCRGMGKRMRILGRFRFRGNGMEWVKQYLCFGGLGECNINESREGNIQR